MGRPSFDTIEITVQWNDEGEPVSVKYYDGQGCGHESGPWDLYQNMFDLVNYHLAHAEKSHNMKPFKLCREVMASEGVSYPKVRCIEDENDHPPKHRFEWPA